jgi:hypothetical protein
MAKFTSKDLDQFIKVKIIARNQDDKEFPL